METHLFWSSAGCKGQNSLQRARYGHHLSPTYIFTIQFKQHLCSSYATSHISRPLQGCPLQWAKEYLLLILPASRPQLPKHRFPSLMGSCKLLRYVWDLRSRESCEIITLNGKCFWKDRANKTVLSLLQLWSGSLMPRRCWRGKQSWKACDLTACCDSRRIYKMIKGLQRPHVHWAMEVTQTMWNLAPERSPLPIAIWGLQPSHGPWCRSGGAKPSVSLVFFRTYPWRFAVESKPPHE